MSREFRDHLLSCKGDGLEQKLGLATAIGAGALIVGGGTALAAWGAHRQRRRNAARKRQWMGSPRALGVRARRRAQ